MLSALWGCLGNRVSPQPRRSEGGEVNCDICGQPLTADFVVTEERAVHKLCDSFNFTDLMALDDRKGQQALDLLAQFIEGQGPCSYDHDGDCQAHDWFNGPCGVAMATALLLGIEPEE
jgi:hypothetical protein